jgi:deazaflavin-dependent oxidoreductase (nitroreductase family)
MQGSRRFLDRVRLFNKRTFNPLILRGAGTSHSPFSVVGHAGRRTGMNYSTPVIAVPLQGGFAFALTYGPGVHWYRNILAAGSCTLQWRGKIYKLDQPETMPVDAALLAFPSPLRMVLKLLHKRDFFRMRVSLASDADLQAA